jgi:sec-independent protein translocase protein TatA
MNFFGIGVPELMLILVIALIVFGPQRLPEVGRSIGKAVRDFRQMSAGFTSEWEELSKEFEETASEVQREVKEVGAQIGEFEGDIEKVARAE